MRVERFEWQETAQESALAVMLWTAKQTYERIDVDPIAREVRSEGEAAVLRLTAQFDATESQPDSLVVDPNAAQEALQSLDRRLRESLVVAAENIREVSEAQLDEKSNVTTLSQGQKVALREVPVEAAGLYAPGGRAAYPSSVLMCAIPAQVAGVKRIALASPPSPTGEVNRFVLAAAALCGITELYAMGGAQAVFAMAYGIGVLEPVNVIVGPGNAWVREAKRYVSGTVGIDSLAGPSELMLVADSSTNTEWAALDLCAQAEHGEEGPLVVVSADSEVLGEIAEMTISKAAERPGVNKSPLALVQVPSLSDAIDFANAIAPEHLELLVEDAAALAEKVTTAGCVFVGAYSATAFGDYVAGSNHVLPTGGAGRFSGPLGPGAFRRKISTVEITAEAAAKLAPHVDRIAQAEGFPVHGESAMIRAEP